MTKDERTKHYKRMYHLLDVVAADKTLEGSFFGLGYSFAVALMEAKGILKEKIQESDPTFSD